MLKGLLVGLFGKRPPEEAMKLERNEPCWCGSGKKYKKCHYESDQRHWSRLYAATCRTAT